MAIDVPLLALDFGMEGRGITQYSRMQSTLIPITWAVRSSYEFDKITRSCKRERQGIAPSDS